MHHKEPEEIIALLTAKLNEAEAQAQWTKAQENKQEHRKPEHIIFKLRNELN